MKGFFKRDLIYMISSIKFALVIAGVGLALIIAIPIIAHEHEFMGGMIQSMLNIYAFPLALGGVFGLSQLDVQSGWMAYAAVLPNGRRDQVTARYLLAAVCCLAATVLAGGGGFLLGGGDSLRITLALLGVYLLVLAFLIPLCYRFDTKGMMILIVAIMVCGGMSGFMVARVSLDALNGGIWMTRMRTISLGLALVGPVAFGISYGISLWIMARKEL